MIQVENEYGSYGEEKSLFESYQRNVDKTVALICLLFTSDESWQAALRAGSLIEDDVLVTGILVPGQKKTFAAMQDF